MSSGYGMLALQCARAMGWQDYRMSEFRRVRIKACYCYGLAVGLLALGSWSYVIFALSCVLGGLFFIFSDSFFLLFAFSGFG